ncbi:MAG: ParB/RepB/Spo0J family partition protein [Gammaproteobacteria bacterium]|nr:ParB/RepB/Spo0J family partition protein [Gammaproteobacteria bacterium]
MTAAKISLQNRKRSSQLSATLEQISQEKKDHLLALKLQALNDVAAASGHLFDLPVSLIIPDPDQPRKTFKNIDILAASIQEQGILQPILVHPKNTSGRYQIIVGERRYQAAKIAGLTTLPCIVRDQEDAHTLVLQLLENDQREQVSPFEEAAALDKLVQNMGLSKKEIAKELGRDPAWISMRLGLLDAPFEIKTLVDEGLVQDLRTLHELRKLAKEDHALFESVVLKLKHHDFQGSHRDLLRQTRATKVLAELPRVLKAEYQEGRLRLFLEGKRNPQEFDIDQTILKQLKGLL